MDIVKRIKELTGGAHHMHIGKVKAHMGVEGNIKADLAAKKVVTQKIIESGVDRNDVSERDLDEAGIDSTCSVSSNGHKGHEWPVHPAPGSTEFNEKYLSEVEKMLQDGHWPNGPPPIAQQGSDDRAAGHVPARAVVQEDEDWQVRNLHASVSNVVKSTSRLGYSNGSSGSIYVKLWRDVAPLLLPGTSHMFWEQFTQSRRKVKTTTVRNAIKLRYGTFWNAKLGKRFNKAYLGRISDGTCPLCNNADSGTHVLGACSHRYLKGLYIERHNEAVAIVGKAIMEGAKGGRLTILVADAGRVTGLAANDRIPQQVLSNISGSLLQRMRPDILMFEKEDRESLSVRLEDLQDVQQRRLCKVQLVEVGYYMEVGYADEYREKTLQHAELMGHLGAAGYAEVQLHLLIFGNTGGNFRLTACHLGQLGIGKQATKSLMEKLHFHALNRLEQIVGTRWRLEHEPPQNKRKREQ